MKYIIKNCPNFIAEYMFFDPCKCEKSSSINGVYQDYCKDINDCLLKRIVELCKSTCRKRCTNDCLGTRKHCGYGQILNLLEIEEVE